MELKNIAGVLFDKDGTLLKYEATWAPINMKAALAATDGNAAQAKALLAATGYDFEAQKVQVGSILGAGNTVEIARAWSGFGANLPERDLVSMLDKMFTIAMRNAVPAPKLNKVVRALHGHGLQLGVASSDSEGSISTFLDGMGLTPLFDFVTGYNSGHGHKPDPGMFEGFCRDQGLNPEQVVMVGDNPQDMEMGRRAHAGLCVAVLSGNGEFKDLEPLADVVLEDISELPSLLTIPI